MDKLINYEDLGSFRENLVNDVIISEKTTWSSDKISTDVILKKDQLVAGQNISIDASNKISALGYRAEHGGFAEGVNTSVGDLGAHAEGLRTSASGQGAHAEGVDTSATRFGAHAEGYLTHANGFNSHAEGRDTVTNNVTEHAEGYGNISHTKTRDTFGNKENTLHSIGIGNSNSFTVTRKNAIEVMQNGDYYLYGVGNYDGVHIKNEDPNINVQTLQEYISSLEARIYALEHPTT